MYDFVDKLKKENNPFTSKITSYSKREVSCMYSGTHSTQKKETQRYIKFCLTEKLIETKNYWFGEVGYSSKKKSKFQQSNTHCFLN